MSLIDDIERIGAAVEAGANRREAIDELRGLFEQHPEGQNIDFWSAGDLLDDWRQVRGRYEAVKDISSRELRQIRAAADIEARIVRETASLTGGEG